MKKIWALLSLFALTTLAANAPVVTNPNSGKAWITTTVPSPGGNILSSPGLGVYNGTTFHPLSLDTNGNITTVGGSSASPAPVVLDYNLGKAWITISTGNIQALPMLGVYNGTTLLPIAVDAFGNVTTSGGGGATYTGADSININGSNVITLVNDSPTPGASKYYGTNGSSTLGYFSLPTSAIWGSITGTLSNQTDLQNALNAKQNTLTPGSISTSTTGVSVGSGSASTVGPNVTVNVQTASGSQPGLLASSDFTSFSNKQAGPLTGDVTTSGAVATLANTAVSPGSYTNTNLTVDSKGRITAASNGSAGGVTSVTGTAPIVSSGGSTPAISITHGNLTAAGTDGIAITSGTGSVIGGGTSVAQHVADSSHNGYLSSGDWTTFNGKVSGPAGTDKMVQFNDGGSFGGASAVLYDKSGPYFGVGMDGSLPTTLSYPFQVGGGTSVNPPTSSSGTINYFSPPSPPASASASATYTQTLADPTSLICVQNDAETGYTADGTNNMTYYVAGYHTVDGAVIYSPGTAPGATFSFSDNNDSSTFGVDCNWGTGAGSGWQIWVTGGVHGGNFPTSNNGGSGNATDTNGWTPGLAYPPTPTGLAYAATGQTTTYHIYDYLLASGVNLFSTTFKNFGFTDDNRSQHPPTSGSAVISQSGGTYPSNNYTHQYQIWAQYADGGYSSTSLNKSVNDGGPTTVPDATGFTAVQNSSGSGYFANGNSMTYTLVSYKNIGGQNIYSAGASTSFTDDSSFTNYSVTLSWTAAPGADGYALFISNGPHFYTYYSQNVNNVVTFNDSDSGWNQTYPFPMNSLPDPSFISASQNDAETGYVANGSNSFTYSVAGVWTGPSGYIFSPGNTNTPFTDNNDSSSFGVDLNWPVPTASGNGVPASNYVVYVTGTSPYNTGYFYQTPVSNSLIDQASGWNAASFPYVFPTVGPASRAFTYEINLNWASVPTATNYLVLKAGGDSGWSYNFYYSTAGTSFSDTDDSIWTGYGGTNPPSPVEGNTTYAIDSSFSAASGSPTYRVLRDINSGGFTTAQDLSATSFVDGNYSQPFSSPITVTNTLYDATGATHTEKAYSNNSTAGIYSTTSADNSVTDDNSGRYYSISWNVSNDPAGADKIKFIIDTANAELVNYGSLPFVDINQSYNSDTTVTPTILNPLIHGDPSGGFYAGTFTAQSKVITPQIGAGPGIITFPSTASTSSSDGISIGTSSTAIGGANSVAIGNGAISNTLDTVVGGLATCGTQNSCTAIGYTASGNASQATTAVGAGSYAGEIQATALGFGANVQAGGSAGTAVGYGAHVSGSNAASINGNATGSASFAGPGSISSGAHSVGLGGGSATSTDSFAFGPSASAGQDAVAMGNSASASTFAVAIGYVSTCSGTSVCLGFGANGNGGGDDVCVGPSCAADGTFSNAFGYNSKSHGNTSLAMGPNTTVASAASNSSSLGQGGTVNSSNSGVWTANGSSISTSSSGSFIVGNGSSIGASSSGSGLFGLNNAVAASSANSYAFGESNNLSSAIGYAFGQGNNIGAVNSMGIGFGSSPGANTIDISSEGNITLSPGQVVTGNVGIKTSSPSTALTVSGTTTTTSLAVTSTSTLSGDTTIASEAHLISTGTAPTTTPNAHLGTSGTCVLTTSTDVKGLVTLTVGTGVGIAAGAQCAINFNRSYGVAPICTLTAQSSVSALATVAPYVTTSTSALTINFGAAGTTTLVYPYFYECIQ